MAKQPVVTRDRFRIFCETEAADMGTVIGQLTRMGFQNIGFELITDVRTFGINGPRKVHETTSEVFATEWISENPTFQVNALVKHFEADGRTASSAYTVAKHMVENGVLRKLGAGSYQHSDVKALEAPKVETAPEKTALRTKNPSTPRFYEVSNHDLLWRHFKNRKKFKSKDVMVLFRAHNRPAKSASSQLTQMTSAGLFKRIGEGEYAVIRKVKAKKSANKKNAPTQHVNGAGTPSVEENANG